MVHERVLSISHNHPSLAGHFPGHPVVPGVVLLNEVIETLRRGSTVPLSVTGFSVVKFSTPLRPGEAVTIRVEDEEDGRAAFLCTVMARPIASGVIEFRSGAPMNAEPA